jgi:hypothetical protein
LVRRFLFSVVVFPFLFRFLFFFPAHERLILGKEASLAHQPALSATQKNVTMQEFDEERESKMPIARPSKKRGISLLALFAASFYQELTPSKSCS